MDMQSMLLEAITRMEVLESVYSRGKDKLKEVLEDIRTAESIGRPVPTNENPATPDNLTPKQRDIYRMLGAGMSMRDIAKKEGRSLKTIQSQRERIRKILGIENAWALIEEAKRNRLP